MLTTAGFTLDFRQRYYPTAWAGRHDRRGHGRTEGLIRVIVARQHTDTTPEQTGRLSAKPNNPERAFSERKGPFGTTCQRSFSASPCVLLKRQ